MMNADDLDYRWIAIIGGPSPLDGVSLAVPKSLTSLDVQLPGLEGTYIQYTWRGGHVGMEHVGRRVFSTDGFAHPFNDWERWKLGQL